MHPLRHLRRGTASLPFASPATRGRPAPGRRFLALVALVALATAGAARAVDLRAAEAPTVLRVQGSTTFNHRLVEPHRGEIETRSGVKFNVIPSKSIWGLIALIEKRADLAMISASLESEMDALLKTLEVAALNDLKAYEIARLRAALAVHPRNPVRYLTRRQVRAILLGDIRNWKEVGGPDLPIRVIATQDGGGTVAAVRTQLLDNLPIQAPEAIRIESATQVVKVASQEPGSFTIAQLTLATGFGLVEVTLPEPIEQVLSLVVKGEPTAEMTALIDATREVALKLEF